MASKNQKWYWVSLGTIALSVISDNVSERTKDIPILNYIVFFFKWIYTAATQVLNFEIKVWIILLGIGFVIFGYWLYNYIKQKNRPLPDYINYTSDTFKQWIWRWQWKPSPEGWRIINLLPFCGKCDVGLVFLTGYTNKAAKCPRCERKYTENNNPVALDNSFENLEEIEQLILANTRTNNNAI